jgi:hypothetical protein
LKVAPVSAEMIANDAPLPDMARDLAPASIVPKSGAIRAKRADVN